MCIPWTYVITRQSNPPISQSNSLCNEFTSVWSMFVYSSINDVVFFCTYLRGKGSSLTIVVDHLFFGQEPVIYHITLQHPDKSWIHITYNPRLKQHNTPLHQFYFVSIGFIAINTSTYRSKHHFFGSKLYQTFDLNYCSYHSYLLQIQGKMQFCLFVLFYLC